MSRTYKTVFFDVGNTLLFPNRERILAPLAECGIVPTAEQLAALERRTKNEFDRLLETTGHADHSFWWMFYTHLLEELGIANDGLRDAMVEATRLSANWDRIRPGTCDKLRQIGKQYRIGVISNSDGKVSESLRVCGIADCFLGIVDSGNVGYEKPHPAIFEVALRELKTRAEESLYVGDVYSVDYLGATRAGMEAMLFDVAGAYRDRGLPRVESLDELQQWLG
ncbi:MAG TPA: HAD family hydrolase [Terriglobales bacterium]|nr:HAD family hydrolase [Terriglobales bacterium]